MFRQVYSFFGCYLRLSWAIRCALLSIGFETLAPERLHISLFTLATYESRGSFR